MFILFLSKGRFCGESGAEGESVGADGKVEKPSADKDEAADFVGGLSGGVHVRGNAGGAEGGGEVKVSHAIHRAKEGGAEGKTAKSRKEGKGDVAASEAESDGGAEKVVDDPEPVVMVIVLGDVVDL